jgi:hypothetical protein
VRRSGGRVVARWSNEGRHIIVERGVHGTPDLVVEVLPPGTQSRDHGVKPGLEIAIDAIFN